MKLLLIVFVVMITSCVKENSCTGDCLLKTVHAPAFPLNIVCVGNSVTYGEGVAPDSSYPMQLGHEFTDSGVLGDITNAGTLTDSLPSPVIVEGDTNIAVVGEIDQTPMDNYFQVDEYLTELFSYCQGLRTSGFKVIIMTNPFRKDYLAYSSYDAMTFDNDMIEINDSIRSNWPRFADGIADMKPLESYNILYDQSDKIDFTAAGYSIMSEIVFNAIKKL
jgi:lysophospholipase L1-like esterase